MLAFVWIWQVNRWMFSPMSRWDNFTLNLQEFVLFFLIVAAFLAATIAMRPTRNKP